MNNTIAAGSFPANRVLKMDTARRAANEDSRLAFQNKPACQGMKGHPGTWSSLQAYIPQHGQAQSDLARRSMLPVCEGYDCRSQR